MNQKYYLQNDVKKLNKTVWKIKTKETVTQNKKTNQLKKRRNKIKTKAKKNLYKQTKLINEELIS